ncbi:Transmembrane protein 50B [Geodia barretti]|uniref:Transmembrane protein 50B n=1 Tax=Geodia barretti TaxID=519541 RepID=A0AA35TSI6_GEOBA|nr:Transmembrane protein 50B [Geodia barretti]
MWLSRSGSGMAKAEEKHDRFGSRWNTGIYACLAFPSGRSAYSLCAWFAVGWWFAIDACAERAEPVYAAFHICGIFSTIALLMINAVSTGQVTGDLYTEGCLGRKGARAWLFVGFVLAFGGLIGSLWILVQEFLVPAVTDDCHSTNEGNSTVTVTTSPSLSQSSGNSCPPGFPHWWQGIAFFLQNLFIFLSTLIFKFGRTEEEVW